MAETGLTWMSATEALKLFKAKKLSPVEMMDAAIKRAKKVMPKLNPFSNLHFKEARAKAKATEARYARGEETGALEGLPLVVKEEATIAGLTATSGSLPLKDNIADETLAIVERCFDAGAIMHARTTTPEFSAAVITHTKLWGVTRNPWNTDYTPGGSSGGTAASVAAGVAPIGTGSDIGGSIRVPASTCGLVGFKPPYGRNPEGRIFNLDHFAVEGPLARSIADCVLLQNVMSGPHPRDIASLRPKLTLPTTFKSVRGMKIALSMDLGSIRVSKEVQKNTMDAVAKLHDAGAIVEEVDLGWTPAVKTAAFGHLSHIFGAALGPMLRSHRHELTDYVAFLADQARSSTALDFIEAQRMVGVMYDTLGPMLQKYEALICPTTAIPAVAADHCPVNGHVEIDGVTVDPGFDWVMTWPFNLMGHCPVLSVPSGTGKNGVPTGLQIVASPYEDEKVFRVGAAVEAADPWFTRPARRPKLKSSKKGK
ncbi:MAG: amidase [Rhodospirillaceae bacterium]|nr:amidase [Rhodospirillaceae bacterium]